MPLATLKIAVSSGSTVVSATGVMLKLTEVALAGTTTLLTAPV
ncbi:UNVERIFIED_ORG: hypothetical protein ABIB63_001858 [Xanthomonas axonopodis]